MKILYVADYQSEELIQRRRITTNIHAGGNTKVSRIARGLSSRGHSVSILATGIVGRRSGRGFRGFDSFIDGTAIPVHYESSIDLPVINHVVGAVGMTRWARRNGPWDCILMYNFGFEPVMTCLDVCGSKRIPLVVEYEDDATVSLGGANRLHQIKGECFINCLQDHIRGAIVVTEPLRLHLRTPNVFVLPGVVEDGHARRPGGHSTGRPKVVYSGGMDFLKGPDILLNALQFVRDEVELHMFGSGPILDSIRALARGVSRHRVTIHGRVEESVLSEALDSAMVCVNPHRMELGHGGSLFPFKVFEYLSKGKPVVTSQISIVSPVIERGLVRYSEDSPRRLAEALSLCLTSYATLSQGAALAAEEINSQYSVSAVAERVERVLALA